MKKNIFDKDTTGGFASSPDGFKTYGSPNSPNQKRWKEFCDETMKKLQKQRSTFPERKPELSEPFLKNNDDLFEMSEILDTKVGCAYAFIADRRAQIAEELQHGSKHNKTEDYGQFRREGFQSYECVFSDEKQLFVWQKDAIFKNCRSLIVNVSQENLKSGQKTIGDSYTVQSQTTKKMIDDKEKTATVYEIEILSPESQIIKFNERSRKHSLILSTIQLTEIPNWNMLILKNPSLSSEMVLGELYLYLKDNEIMVSLINHLNQVETVCLTKDIPEEHRESIKNLLNKNDSLALDDEKIIYSALAKQGYTEDRGLVHLFYTDINKHSLKGDFLLADKYYTQMEKAAEEGNVEEFLINGGRLSHLLAHLLPIKRGNASCIELLIRELALEKGLELGPFSYIKEKISWDWKALVTPNREEYASWYAKNAFENAANFKFQKLTPT